MCAGEHDRQRENQGNKRLLKLKASHILVSSLKIPNQATPEEKNLPIPCYRRERVLILGNSLTIQATDGSLKA